MPSIASRKSSFLFAAVTLSVGGAWLMGCGDNTPTASTGPTTQVALSPMQSGHDLYITNCASCHATNLKGMPRQGSNLLRSKLVRDSDDGALTRFIIRGRTPNDPDSTMRLLMPQRGNNSKLTNDEISDIAAYLKAAYAEANAGAAAPNGIQTATVE